MSRIQTTYAVVTVRLGTLTPGRAATAEVGV
jgi:hypothetical protein